MNFVYNYPMSNYRKGAQAEREVCHILEELGYKCTRSAGSKGQWDVIAIHPQHIRLIQVKVEGAMTPIELEQIKLYNAPMVCSKEVWTRRPGKTLEERWMVEVYR